MSAYVAALDECIAKTVAFADCLRAFEFDAGEGKPAAAEQSFADYVAAMSRLDAEQQRLVVPL